MLPNIIQAFLKIHWDQRSPLLLGYSGGPDSKALLYALLQSGMKNFHVAHVDHGWREESQEEAEELRQEAARLGVCFHSIRLNLSSKSEDEARKGRLGYFKSLFAKTEYQALLLAHQADDLAETVLKRIFEGAHLSHLSGMRLVSTLKEMTVWRPLLNIRKKELQHFLDQNQLTPLIDATNDDPAYLRARMRREIFPFLTETFGKEIVGNLGMLSERAAEFKDYLDRRVQTVPIQKGLYGISVDLNGLESLEQTHLLQEIAKREGLSLTRSSIDLILDWVERKLSSKEVTIQARKVAVDRGIVSFSYALTTSCSLC